jgi:hypothetical protein
MQRDPAHAATLLQISRKRLQALEEQAARYGVDCPAHINIEIDDLRDLLEETARREIPPLLPYLADRSEQEECLAEALAELKRQPHRPLVSIVYGDEHQCHDMFLQRITDVTLPRLLKLDSSASITPYQVEWPDGALKINELPRRLLRRLAYVVLDDIEAQPEEINRRLAAHPGPVVIHIHLLFRDWKKVDESALQSFLRFWQGWPNLLIGQILIVCMFIKYEVQPNLPADASTKILKSLKKLPAGASESIICTVLPALEGISRQAAEDWTRRPETAKFCANEDLRTRIREIYKESSSISMEQLAARLEHVLTQFVIMRAGSI